VKRRFRAFVKVFHPSSEFSDVGFEQYTRVWDSVDKAHAEAEQELAFRESKKGTDVVVITDSNWAEYRNSTFALICFAAQNCGHCKDFEPEYAKGASEVKAKGG
jgi:hypothetical protein